LESDLLPMVMPLIGPRKFMARSAIHEVVKTVVRGSAARLRLLGPELEDAAAHLEQASTDWMRHTAGSHLSEKADLKVVEQSLNGVFSPSDDSGSAIPSRPSDECIVEFHELNDAIAASDLGAASCAAAIILILNGMLLALKDDMDTQNAAWESTPPFFGTQSVGAILVAASNYFRHSDEWIKTQPPSPRQARSAAVLWAALGGANAGDANHPFNSEDACVQTLAVLGGQSFDQLNLNFFTFARNLAAK
jgi:hypothetical protein